MFVKQEVTLPSALSACLGENVQLHVHAHVFPGIVFEYFSKSLVSIKIH